MEDTTIAAGAAAPPLLLAGTARGGTTWVLDALAEANGLRTIFEPLHPKRVGSVSARYAHGSLRPEEPADDLESFLRLVFAGRFHSLWTDYRVHRDHLYPVAGAWRAPSRLRITYHHWTEFISQYRKFKPRTARSRLMVKCIRANLMLGWICRRFRPRAVLLVRHPAAVVESQLNLGWNARDRIRRYRDDPVLAERLPEAHRRLLGAELSVAAGLTLLWCIENDVVMKTAPTEGFAVVHYEDLRFGGAEAWGRLAQAFDLAHVPSTELLVMPSQQASQRWKPGHEDVASHGERWLDSLPADVKREMESVLAELGVDAYSMSRPEPVRRQGLSTAQPPLSHPAK